MWSPKASSPRKRRGEGELFLFELLHHIERQPTARLFRYLLDPVKPFDAERRLRRLFGSGRQNQPSAPSSAKTDIPLSRM